MGKKKKFHLLLLFLFFAFECADRLKAQDPTAEVPLIDVFHYDISAEIEPDRSFLRGEARVEFDVLQETLAVPFSFNRQMTLIDVRDEDDTRLAIRTDDFSRDRVRIQWDETLESGERRKLTFRFEGLLEKEQYAFLDVPSTQKAVIDPDGAHLLSEGFWFPSHRLATDSATAAVRVTVPLGFSVVAPGLLAGIETVGLQEAFRWESDLQLTGLPVLVGRYFRQTFNEGPVPLTFYVTEDFEGDLNGWSKTLSEVIQFYADEYGDIPFPALTLVQAGKLQLGSPGSRGLILLEGQVLETDLPPVNQLARRLALQWWGFSVRPARPIDAWLADGFATYAMLRYFQEKQTEQFETELARQAVEALKYQDTAPVISGINLEVGSPKYNSIVASKGAWILYMLGQLVGADELNQSLREFYRRQIDKPTTINEFVKYTSAWTGEDYGWFFVQWIESVGVPEFQLDYTIFKLKDGGFKIRGQVKQNLELFRMPMDIRIETKGEAEEKNLLVTGKSTNFTFDVETVPTRLEMDPKGKVLMDSDRMRVAVRIAIGDEYREAGEFVSAIDEYESAIESNARSSLAHFRLGQTFFEQHSYSNAANSMRDSLNGDLKPEWVETWAHIYLGKVYDILGQRQRAKAEYQKAVNTNIDFDGAQAEARKYLDEPYSKPSTLIG